MYFKLIVFEISMVTYLKNIIPLYLWVTFLLYNNYMRTTLFREGSRDFVKILEWEWKSAESNCSHYVSAVPFCNQFNYCT